MRRLCARYGPRYVYGRTMGVRAACVFRYAERHGDYTHDFVERWVGEACGVGVCLDYLYMVEFSEVWREVEEGERTL